MDLKAGKGVQVVSAGPGESFSLDEKALKTILQRYDVRDRSVVIVSVAGAFHKGKSFLLDFFLRYLHYKYNLNRSGDEWLGAEDEPLSSFSWRGGSERDTTGLLFWSQPFKATLDNGEKVVIYLMDTQGTFDSGSTVKDDVTMFALSTMLVSAQIYNLSQNLAENDLQYLQVTYIERQLFTEYGRLAQQTVPGPPFQRLQILIRDWSFPYEHQYGAEGGRELLEKRLKLHNGQPSELQLLRNHVASCFHDLTCFLMPHPGFNVSTDPHFDGKLSDINQEFKLCLMHLVPMLLAPENLIVKRIGGQKLKSRDMFLYCTYIKIFNGTSLPEPKTIFNATTEANNLLAMAKAKKVYETLMEETAGGSKPYLEPHELQTEYHRILDKALHVFRTKKKMGGDQISKTYSAKLVEELEGQYERCRLRNEEKRVPPRLDTAAVLLALALVGYILAALAYLLGLESLQTFGKLTAVTFLITLIVWIYAMDSQWIPRFGHRQNAESRHAVRLSGGMFVCKCIAEKYTKLTGKIIFFILFSFVKQVKAGTANGERQRQLHHRTTTQYTYDECI